MTRLNPQKIYRQDYPNGVEVVRERGNARIGTEDLELYRGTDAVAWLREQGITKLHQVAYKPLGV